MIKSICACAFSLVVLSTAHGAETPWVEVGPDAHIRLISSDILGAGVTNVALEIDMPSEMKTYWRIPGETGIPTQMDIAGSSNVSAVQIAWPYPTREQKDGFIDFVYYGNTVIPGILSVGEGNGVLVASIFMGICDEICVPVSVTLELPLDFSTADRAQDLRIKQALNDTPLPWRNQPPPLGDVLLIEDDMALQIKIDPANVDPFSVIVDNGDPSVLLSMPSYNPADQIVAFTVLGKKSLEGLRNTSVNLTFQSQDGAYEMQIVAK